jgi:predicted double-glycine peptidase
VKINIKKAFAKDKLHIQACTYACGPSALLNVLALKGNYVHNERELIKLCKAMPKVGTSHENLVKAARLLGLNVIEEKKNASIEDIERNIDHHAYVIVNYLEAFDGEGHYSVITNYDKKSFYFMDSALGQLRLKKKLFLRWWYNQNKTIYRWYVSVN